MEYWHVNTITILLSFSLEPGDECSIALEYQGPVAGAREVAPYIFDTVSREYTLMRLDSSGTGCVSLGVNKQNHWAELGYWIGKPYWSKGYCTEAAGALLDYGFKVLELNRIQARHLVSNPASGRVMQKLGMSYEGTLRQVVFLRGSYEDLAVYAILRDESIVW